MSRPGFSFCLCPDARLLRDRVESLLTRYPPSPDGEKDRTWERRNYWSDAPLPDVFWEQLTLKGLFDTPKALVVHNAQDLPAENWKRLSAALGQARAQVWPFFCLTPVSDRGKAGAPAFLSRLPCFIFAEKQGWVWISPGLDARAREHFVRAEAQRLNIVIPPDVLEILLRRLPPDAAAIGTEMEKLALAAGPDGTLPASAPDLIDHEPEPDLFSLMRALQSGRTEELLRVSALQRNPDKFTFAFLSLLAREARQLWQLQAGDPVSLPSSIYGAKKNLARALGMSGIARLWRLALEADKSVKSGERGPDQALERLTGELSLLFAATKRR
jgi:DNA polymerase-3 subunit delta